MLRTIVAVLLTCVFVVANAKVNYTTSVSNTSNTSIYVVNNCNNMVKANLVRAMSSDKKRCSGLGQTKIPKNSYGTIKITPGCTYGISFKFGKSAGEEQIPTALGFSGYNAEASKGKKVTITCS